MTRSAGRSCDLKAKIIHQIWGQVSSEETQHGRLLHCTKVRTHCSTNTTSTTTEHCCAQVLQLYYSKYCGLTTVMFVTS